MKAAKPFADHWNRNTLTFLNRELALAEKLVQIATGFFSVEGYDLIREHISDKRVELMVGYDENSKERLRKKLVEDIVFQLRTWGGMNRRAAVEALVAQLRRRRFRLREQQHPGEIDARLRNRDHAKVYIVDQTSVLVGSSNLTASGLRNNVEGVSRIDEPARVDYWVARFKYYWEHEETIDLTQALLELLEAWLRLATPFDIYLKSIAALIPDAETPPPRPRFKMPVNYQLVVCERVLRQLQQWGGAMLVASTGLGKTIMATYIAYRLRAAGDIINVIVFAPQQVHPNWERELYAAGVSCKVFTRDLLDYPLTSRSRKVRAVVEALEAADDKTLIFVDESHHFRNKLRAKDGAQRHSFRRLNPAVNERGARIVLLTATPFAKGVEDLNNQLYLLTHSAEAQYVTSDGQHAIPGMIDDDIDPNAWKVIDQTHFFERFIDLPVCTVISTSRVARDFAATDEQGSYLAFGDERRWFPQVEINLIQAPVLLEQPVAEAIRLGAFKHQMRSFQTRGEWQRSEVTIQNQAETAWLSSPVALREVVEKTLDGTYEETWQMPAERQHALLQPIADQLAALGQTPDRKCEKLIELLRAAQVTGQKVLVFTERRATAVYLESVLAQALPTLRVVCVARKTPSGYELKDFNKEVRELVANFAPVANGDYWEYRDDQPHHYDVFISTDAYSAGVNLQDASIVINYDLAWTPDTLIQRAGRILRLWHMPRTVSIYIFIGQFLVDAEGMHRTAGVERRLRQLTQRGKQASRFSEMALFGEEPPPVLPDDTRLLAVEELGPVDITELEEFTGVSAFLHHIAMLKAHADHLATLPDDISSALVYPGEDHHLYLLLRHNRTYYHVLYNIDRDTIRVPGEDELLALLKCERETPTANVDPGIIEMHAQKCRQRWLEQQPPSIDALRLERICALYLQPQRDAGSVGKMLRMAFADG